MVKSSFHLYFRSSQFISFYLPSYVALAQVLVRGGLFDQQVHLRCHVKIVVTGEVATWRMHKYKGRVRMDCSKQHHDSFRSDGEVTHRVRK